MAVKIEGHYFSGEMYFPNRGGWVLGDELTDVRPSSVVLDCKYCYTDDVETVESHEYITGHTMQLLCAKCGAGLTPCDPVPDDSP